MSILLEMKKLRFKMTEEIEAGTKRQINALLTDLREATPVDTGEARDSWTATVTKPGIVRVENHTEHIKYLNEGSSKQAPAHFIERTAMKHGKPLGAIVEVRS